jgi:hypothetical protein
MPVLRKSYRRCDNPCATPRLPSETNGPQQVICFAASPETLLRLDVRRLLALQALLDFERHLLVFLERLETA